MNYTHVLWDFNGTLLDDVQIGIDCINVLLRKRGLKTIESIDEYHRYFEFPIINYYKNLGLCTCEEDYIAPADEWVKEYLARSPHAPLYPHVHKALQTAKDRGLRQIILSATEKNMLLRQLDELKILPYFEEVLGQTDVYARGKTDIAKRWREKNPAVKAVLIGDSDHDAEVARAIGIDCLLVASGHQAKAALETCGCPVYNDLSEILSLFQ